jgi:tetratricopeptide (TPR) repeat protein
MTLPEIAKELGVDAVVIASVVSSGNQLHINVQLIDASENRNLWADSFDRQMQNILGLYGEMARTIAAAVHVVVAPAEAARLENQKQVNPEAYRFYLLGERFVYKLSEKGINQGIEFCMRAIEIDSTYAPAYATLSKYYFLLTNGAMMHPQEARPLAEAAARKALELDPELGAAHAASAIVQFAFDWDFDAADAGFRWALALNPGDDVIKEGYCFALALEGRADEAIDMTRQLTEADPLNVFQSGALGYYYWWAGRLDEAIDQFNRTLEMAPEYWYCNMQLSWCYADKGMKEETIAYIERALSVAPAPLNQVVLGHSAHGYALVGMEEEARRILEQLQQRSQSEWVDPWYVALIHVALGEYDRAFELLRECIEVGSMSTVFIKNLRWVDPLRSDPRFQEILELAFGSSP